MTRWNLSVAGTPEETSAACTASSTVVLNALGFGLRTVIVTRGIAAPEVIACYRFPNANLTWGSSKLILQKQKGPEGPFVFRHRSETFLFLNRCHFQCR